MMILVILVISPLSISLQVSYKLIKLETNALSGCLLFGAFFFYCLTKINVHCINKNMIKSIGWYKFSPNEKEKQFWFIINVIDDNYLVSS